MNPDNHPSTGLTHHIVAPALAASAFDAVEFVLLQTSHPGNVGAAARSLAVMGFSKLTLVAPREARAHDHPDARAFASGARHILTNCRVVATLDDALADARYAVAISAQGRKFAQPPQPPEVMAQDIARRIAAMLADFGDAEPAPAALHHALPLAPADSGRADAHYGAGLIQPSLRPGGGPAGAPIALVFGNERDGFTLEQAQRCNALCSIPTAADYNSLNLAQAVQVLAYVTRQALLAPPAGASTKAAIAVRKFGDLRDAPAPQAHVQGMLSHLEKTLMHIGFLEVDQPKRLMPRLRNLYMRAGLSIKEVDILRGICSQMTLYTDRLRRKLVIQADTDATLSARDPDQAGQKSNSPPKRRDK